eukprot:gene13238-3869_t
MTIEYTVYYIMAEEAASKWDQYYSKDCLPPWDPSGPCSHLKALMAERSVVPKQVVDLGA